MSKLVLSLLITLAAAELHAQSGPGRIWTLSAGAVAAATAADAQSSWGRVELNPLLRAGDGRFGARATAIKCAVAGGGLLAQWLILRRNPKAARYVGIANFGVAGMLTGFTVHNRRLPPDRPAYLLRQPSATAPESR